MWMMACKFVVRAAPGVCARVCAVQSNPIPDPSHRLNCAWRNAHDPAEWQRPKPGRWTLEIVKRSDAAKAFEILPRR